jgi:hypothetical protein
VAARLNGAALVRETRSGNNNRMTYELDRRRLLRRGLAVAATALAGCRWESETASPLGAPPSEETAAAPTPSPPPASPAVQSWDPIVPPLLVGSHLTFDLSRTLPASIARGGRFSVDTAGAPLPRGMSLSTAGLLAVGTAAIGSVVGVVFAYEAP